MGFFGSWRLNDLGLLCVHSLEAGMDIMMYQVLKHDRQYPHFEFTRYLVETRVGMTSIIIPDNGEIPDMKGQATVAYRTKAPFLPRASSVAQ